MAAPWLEVGDRERFLLVLRTALRAVPSVGTPFQMAVTELRWLAAYYGIPEACTAAHASELHTPPKAM